MTHKLLTEIASTDSKNEKISILKRESDAKNTEFFNGLMYAFNPMQTFGVKQIPDRVGVDGPGLPFIMFKTLADALIRRTVTGHAALDAIDQMMSQATNAEWNGWYKRILQKDVKSGFSEESVNKAVSLEYQIPIFKSQLAKDCVDEDGNVDESELKGKKLLDTKLDGMRVLSLCYPAGKVDQFSRNGKELVNFGVIKGQISSVVSSFSEPMVLDAEVMSKNFQDLMKQARRKTDVQADDSVLNLIDIIPLREFVTGVGTVKQRKRLETLHAWYEEHADKLPNVAVLGYEEVDLDTKVGQARLYEINAIALAAKAEGIMLKDPDAVYECKRSKNWQKMKPFIEESLTATDVEEGKIDSKFEGTMGAVVFEGIVDGKKVKVNCGGGWSIKQRAQIWADFTGKPVNWQKKEKGKWVTYTEKPTGNSVIGMIGEIRADALTKAQDSEIWAMRFPRFKVWRGNMVGEKL